MIKRKPLSPSTRIQLLDDYAADKPSPTKTDLWCEKKAMELECHADQVKRFIAGKLELLERQAEIAGLPMAQKLAQIIGATRTKALATLDAALTAKKVRLVLTQVKTANEDGTESSSRTTTEVTEPDWDIRLSAADKLLKIYGSYAPQEITVRHGLTDELKALSDEEIKQRMQQLFLSAGQSEETGTQPN